MGVAKKNIKLSVAEFIFIASSQFIMLKLISYFLGVAEIGLWSIIASAVQMAKLVDPGATAGSLKFIAVAAHKNDRDQIEKSISSSFCVTAIMYLIVMIPGFYIFPLLLSHVVEHSSLKEAYELVPYVIISFYLQNIYNSFSTCINNVGFGYAKSIINIFGVIIQIIISAFFIKTYGLIALAAAQIINNIITAIMCVVFLKVKFNLRYLKMFSIDFEHIKTVLKVGSKVQGTSIAWTLFELSIRLIMGKVGGLTVTGYYEVAYRISAQFRILGSYLIAPVTPNFAKKHNADEKEAISYYKKIYSYVSSYGLASFFAILILSPVLSFIMFKSTIMIFCVFCLMTAASTLMHIMAMSSEQYVVALGQPNYNLAGTIFMLFLNIGLSWGLGKVWGPIGIATGCMASVVISAALILYFNSKKIIHSNYFPNFYAAMRDFSKFAQGIAKREKSA